MMKIVLLSILVLIATAAAVTADGVANPPTIVYGWSFTTGGTPIASGADTTIDFTAPRPSQVQVNPNQSSGTSAQPQVNIQLGPTSSVLLLNDNATGGANIYANLNSISAHATGGTPADGTAGSATIILFPGDRINVDGKYTGVGLRSSTGNSAARVFASY